MPAGVVPQRIFHSGRGSFEAIGQLRAAVGNETAENAIQGFAAGAVLRHAARPDGTIDPVRLASWRRSHADALRAVPALDARLADAGRASDAIAEVTTARKAASDMAQKGALGRLLQVDAPEDVTRIIGGVFSAQDAVGRMRAIRGAIGNDTQAAEGLRRAVIEHMNAKAIGNAEVGTSGTAGVKSDAFQGFVRQNEAALREAGFASGELQVLDAIAADLQRAGRSVSGVKNPGGSDTMQNVFAGLRGETPFRAAIRLLGAPGGIGLGVGAANGGVSGLAAGAGAGLFVAMRNAGLRTVDDLVTDAMLNPERARLLLSHVQPAEEADRLQALLRSYNRSAVLDLAADADADAPQRDRRAEIQQPRRPVPQFRTGDPLIDALAARKAAQQITIPQSGGPLVDALAARGGR